MSLLPPRTIFGQIEPFEIGSMNSQQKATPERTIDPKRIGQHFSITNRQLEATLYKITKLLAILADSTILTNEHILDAFPTDILDAAERSFYSTREAMGFTAPDWPELKVQSRLLYIEGVLRTKETEKKI